MRFALQVKWAQCVSEARTAIALKPALAMAWNNLATCQNALRNFAEAERSARHAITLDPGLVLAKKNLAFAVAKGDVPGMRKN